MFKKYKMKKALENTKEQKELGNHYAALESFVEYLSHKYGTDVQQINSKALSSVVDDSPNMIFEELMDHGIYNKKEIANSNLLRYLVLTHECSELPDKEKYIIECKRLDSKHEVGFIDETTKKIEKNEIAYFFKIISENEYNIQSNLLSIESLEKSLENEDISFEDKVETKQKIKELKIENAKLKFKEDKLSYKEMIKEINTIEGNPWFSFEIGLDRDYDDPSMVEMDFEYNNQFVDWLLSKEGYAPPDEFLEENDIEKGSEEYREVVTEGWAKSTIVRLAASFLRDGGDEDGSTFRSVVANEPEGTIVEEVEIDKEYYEDNPDELEKVKKAFNNRRIYK